MLLLKAAYREPWNDAAVTASTVAFLSWLLDDMEGFFLADNYDLSLPGDLAAYMAVNCLAILVLTGLAAWFISRKHLDEEYRNFLSGGRRFGFWRGVFFLLPAVRVTAVELVNEICRPGGYRSSRCT